MTTRKSNSNKLNPSLLAGADEERHVINSTSKGRADRVSLNKNDTWIIRFVHPKLGPDKNLWYARIAQHWVNKKPIFCPRFTAKWLGGDEEVWCPVCEAAENLNEDKNDKVSTFGFKLRSQLKWITYCLVWEKAYGNAEELIDLPDAANVYQFEHYKTTFDELMGFVRSYRRAEWGIFDLDAGCDFSVTRTAKGMRLAPILEPTPIFADYDMDDASFKKYMKRVEEQLREPSVKIPSEKALIEFADKAYEEAEKIKDEGTGRSRRRAARRDDDDDGDDSEDAPAGRARRSRVATDDEEEAPTGRAGRGRSRVVTDDEEEAPPATARRSRVSTDDEEAPPARERRSSSRRHEPVNDDDEGGAEEEEAEAPRSGNRRRSAPAEEPEDDVPYTDEVKPSDRSKVRVEPEDEGDDLPPTDREGRRPSTMERRAFTETKGRRGGGSASSLDEDENVPEEDKDPAPPIENEAEDKPKREKASARIADRVSRVAQRGE